MKKNLLLIVFVLTCLVSQVHAQWTQCLDTVGVFLSSSGNNIFAGRSPYGVYLSTDTGNTWTPVNTGLGVNPNVKALGSNGVHVFTMLDTSATNHLVYSSANTGSTWALDGTGLANANVISFAFQGSNSFAATNGGGVFLSTNNGGSWTAVNTGLTNLIVRSIAFVGTNIFAGTKLNGVFLSTNNGGTWTAVTNGMTNLTITALATYGINIFAGTSGGGVFTSNDNGSNWTAVNSGLPGISIQALTTVGSNVFAAVDNGGVFLSTDNGANWSDQTGNLPTLFPSALATNRGYLFTGMGVDGVWKTSLSDMGICIPTSSTSAHTACFTYTSPSGNQTWTSSGTYTDTLVNAAGCDSVLTINLTINTVNVAVTQNGDTLTASAVGAVYQWLNCNTGFSPIAGATNRKYTATANGSYAVHVTQNGCGDTSACVNMTSVGIVEHTFKDKIIVNPNPTTGNLSLDLGEHYSNVRVEITDLTGRLVYSKRFDQAKLVDLRLDEPAGTYLLSVTTDSKKATFRLIKE